MGERQAGQRTGAWTDPFRRIAGGARRRAGRLPVWAAERGVPAAWLGHRWVGHETVSAYAARCGGAARLETVHPPAVASNPLPRNVAGPDDLPSERGWWGFSFRDVPARASAETVIATVPDCRIVSFVEPDKGNFYPCILNRDGRALHLREIAFRPGHRDAIRSDAPPFRLARATWVLERVYHNHSHWLTAHLPKLRLLQELGRLDGVLLPQTRTPVIEASLRMLGLDPGGFATYDPSRPLQVDELTVLATDRFRSELLRPVRAAAPAPAGPPWRRVFISRARSRGRRLLDEEAIWPMLRHAGFERTFMEDLDFDGQVRLMQETAVLLAPHGAGLTNMLFCQPGAQVVEIADPGFPNPNFYALASAMGLGYWLIGGEAVGDGHPLDRDLRAGADRVRQVLKRLGRNGLP